ncbi:hypothetical protein HBI56_204480 [Parastagonospora nodorum]|uniref:Uncharacterized protein n=2 Tax=Phaeosphaeria nodorum (strain SN15 / ATCC MYA-4574 / FGSC 10173) TaxID=321614 RepID=A0A7U2FGU5_PHANO|nr:hypothetical protein HBH56_114470 [Parastagonospora nodorum]QRD04963.1 hypothetical protein JI435_108810 [Parastagonospora nodorum SN15]KAH3928779.1 hypothetical protein HBH54_134680 [Parastagonospora nodorum]KAH3950712.1 hypothetical protein HBH53_074960 [Parastagonospora nodorum]KAH3998583.1 hypothetical protein HBI10_123810 [Parastagonospora nodorum]
MRMLWEGQVTTSRASDTAAATHDTPIPIAIAHQTRSLQLATELAMSIEHCDTRREPTERLTIAVQDALPLVADKPTLFSLPGELRNAIYHLALDKDYQRVPLNPVYLNKPDPYIALLQTCSAVYHEARSYMVEKQTAYIPVMPGLDWSYGEPAADYGLSRATKDTTICALTDFVSVHFHLHLDLSPEEDYSPEGLLDVLAQAIEIFASHSWPLYLKHNLCKRRAVVHLDHLLSLWPKLFSNQNCIDIGALQRLIELMARDKMTDWKMRYYVATGQANTQIAYGYCHRYNIQDTELAQICDYARPYSSIKVFAEMYGENTAWDYGDATGCVTRMRTPVTEFWPNLHFDAHRYPSVLLGSFRFEYRSKFETSLHGIDPPANLSKGNMLIDHFDEEVLQARHARGGGCKLWLLELEKKIHIRDAEEHGINDEERFILTNAALGDFTGGWEFLLDYERANREVHETVARARDLHDAAGFGTCEE